MKVLLTGASGQLGQALIASKPPEVELIATSRSGGVGLLALDLADADACRAAVQLTRPWIGPRASPSWPRP
jgi:dTDP-4-dehydrorhamnose reductase